MGSVDEPYLTGTPDLGTFAGRWLYYGFTFGEAAYAAQTTLSWQTTVVGDPLYRPFGKNVAEQHRALLQQTNRLAEWSTLRIGNLSRNQGLSALDYATALETTPLTKTSAVLTEKLADLYTAQGKPASAIAACERALALDPTFRREAAALEPEGHVDEADQRGHFDQRPDHSGERPRPI
jgi:tetratricopeptide (TPR) repeat protein